MSQEKSMETMKQLVSDWLKQHRAPLTADAASRFLEIIDQRFLPYDTVVVRLETFDQALDAIQTMQVRGAPLIGLCGAYGMALAMEDNASDEHLARCAEQMSQARPTAVNLAYAVDYVADGLKEIPTEKRAEKAWALAAALEAADREQSFAIGYHGLKLIETHAATAQAKGRPVSILTHCNAGRLATAGWGTALAPMYFAHILQLPIHVYVDETRPRNQGYLTAWELSQAHIPHRVIVDNAGGHLMQQGKIDLVIVGADRVSLQGDVCNKIGTYLKALAAQDNQVPCYSAFPLSTVDWALQDGVREIPIEARAAEEIYDMQGLNSKGMLEKINVLASHHAVENPGFDVTPARLWQGLITEKGLCSPASLSQWRP